MHNFFCFEMLIVSPVGILLPGLLPVGCRHPSLLVPETGQAWSINIVNIVHVIIMAPTNINGAKYLMSAMVMSTTYLMYLIVMGTTYLIRLSKSYFFPQSKCSD